MTTKKQYKADKHIKDLYHSMQSNPGESYSDFKRRVRKNIGY